MPKYKTKKDELIQYIKQSNYDNKKELISYIKNDTRIYTDELCKVFKIIIDNKVKINEINDNINCSLVLHNIIKEQDLYDKLLPYYMQNPTLFHWYELEDIYYLFNNKNNIEYIIKNIKYLKEGKIDKVFKYIIASRKYYVDEAAFLSNLMEIIKNVTFHSVDDLDIYLKEKLEEDKKLGGLYDIDESTLEKINNKNIELENKVINSTKKLEQINSYIEETESKLQALLKQYKQLKTDITEKPNNSDYKDDKFETHLKYRATECFNTSKIQYLEAHKLKGTADKSINQKYIEKIMDILRFNENLNDNLKKRIILEYYAESEGSLDVFHRIEFIEYKYDFIYYLNILKKSNIERFENDVYFDMLSNKFDQLIHIVRLPKNIDLYLNILKINPNFDLGKYDVYKFSMYDLQKIVDLFGLNVVANQESLFAKNIIEISKEYYYDYRSKMTHQLDELFNSYKEIYDINPNYSIVHLLAFDTLLNHLSIKEIATLSENQQYIIFELLHSTNSKQKKFVEKVINNEGDFSEKMYINDNLIKILKKSKLTFEDYSKIDYKTQEQLADYYYKKEYSKMKLKIKVYESRKDIEEMINKFR